MKRLLFLFLIVLPFCLVAQSCNPDDEPFMDETERPLPPSTPNEGEEDDDADDSDNDDTDDDTPMNHEITINIDDTHYTATLEDNPTAKAFAALLPMTVTMTEMNGNEKYYNLSENLPTDTFRPGTIRTGDLLLWGANTVVLFYETFSSSYSYTRLGKIDNPNGLAAALGSGNVSVTFSAQ